MRRCSVLLAVVGLVLGLTPMASAHEYWEVYDRCDLGDTYFYLGGPARWWWFHSGAPEATGGCHPYTRNAQTQTYNYADWYLPTQSCDLALPSTGSHNDGRCYNEKRYTGNYGVFVYIPRDGHFTTRRAQYVRYAFSLMKGPTSFHYLDQATGGSGNRLLFSPGWFDTRVDFGYAGFMRLNDFTGEASQSRYVGVEKLFWYPNH